MNGNYNNINAFEKMSKSFERAFGYSNSGLYKHSIPLYEQALSEDKNNFAALNNMAVAKIYMGIEERNKTYIENAISDLKEAIRIAREVYQYPDGYPIAEGNLKWAQNELLNLE
jgi:tetratricopeptide (TPR) repeat protein